MISIDVTNSGAVAGAVVVQAYCIYLSSPKVRIMRYAKMLCGFEKVHLIPMQKARVDIRIPLDQLARWDSEMPSSLVLNSNADSVRGSYVIDAGHWAVAVADCSAAGSAIGLQDAFPCVQQNTSFYIPDTITFNGS